MDKLNADGNLIGRLGALIVIGAVVVGLGRVCGLSAMCPVGGQGKSCCLLSPKTPATPTK